MRVARLGAGLALLFSFALASADVAVPPLSARVIDLTGTLSGGAVARIEAKLKDLEARKGSQIAVLIVPSTQPEDIEQYGIRVAETWKLGRKGISDGAILLVAKDDRRARIEVGYGLEGPLPDAIANRIIDETITPRFKLGDYDGGVEKGVDQMISVVNGEPLPQPDRKWERHNGLGNILPLFLVVVVVVVGGGVLRAMFGRLFGSVATGGLAGGIVWLLSHVIPIGLGAGVFAFAVALLTGGARSGWSTGGGGWGGMGGFGGGFGGGGFGGGGFGGGGGGFSGGGGGFGGGGASGSW